MPFWKTKKERTKSCYEKKEGQDLHPGGSYSLIKPDDLVILKKLENGWYGKVEKGQWNCGGDKKVYVAIKSVPVKAQGEILLDVNRMLLLHPNLITLYGISLPDQQLDMPLRLVTEYARFGSLLKNLKERNKEVCSVLSFHCYAVQIASGMEYLAQNKIVHEDLGAHNVLVFEPDKVKISDFGLAQHYHKTKALTERPITWCAPEVADRQEYSTASDAWGFGMLLWVMFSFGRSPLEILADNEKKNATILKEPSQRLPCPESCPKQIYELIIDCWEKDPEYRPTFVNLHKLLKRFKLVQVKTITGCQAVSTRHLSYRAGNKITVVSSGSDNNDVWFGELQEVGNFGLFDAKNVEAIEDDAGKSKTFIDTISRPFNLQRRKTEDVLRELEVDEKTILRLKKDPNYSSSMSDPLYVDMDGENATGKLKGAGQTGDYTSVNIYESPNHVNRSQSEDGELRDDYYRNPLKLLHTGEARDNQRPMEGELGKSKDMNVFIQQKSENSLEEMSESSANSKALLQNNQVGVKSPVANVLAPFSAPRWQKRHKTPPPVPERTDLMENGFRETHSESIIGKNSSEMPAKGAGDTATQRRRPVPTPRRRNTVSCPLEERDYPSAETEKKLAVKKPSPDTKGETAAIRQQHCETKTTDGAEKTTEFDPNFNRKSTNGSMKIPSRDFPLDGEQISETRDGGQTFYFKFVESANIKANQQLNQSRSLPDGSETPDAIGQLISLGEETTENYYQSLKFASENLKQCSRKEEFDSGDYTSIHLQPSQAQVGGVNFEEDGERPPALPRKDILSRSLTGLSRLSEPILPPPFSQDFNLSGSGDFPPSYPDQITEAQIPPALPPKDIASRSPASFEPNLPGSLSSSLPSQNFHLSVSETQRLRDRNLDGVRAEGPNKRPLPSVPGMPLTQAVANSQYDKCWPNNARSNPIPISQPQIAAEGQSNTSRPLPPVPSPPLSQTSAEAIFLQQSRSSSFSPGPLGKDGENKPVLKSSSELEQPIYDILLPPVPLPPTIPKHILNQPPPDYLPFPSGLANSDIHSENKVEVSANNSTHIYGKVTSRSDSDPSVLSFEELERKYGRHAEAVEQIHKEFPYDYDTCHAWLVAYNGDQQEVLRYFKINTLVSFTHKSEKICVRALDLYGMDLQRAANHLITSD